MSGYGQSELRYEDSRRYEQLVRRVLAERLGGGWIVEPGVFEEGRNPGRSLQIDVLATYRGPGPHLRILVEAKNWRSRVGRSEIERLPNRLNQIEAHRALVVSPEGFSRDAVDLARDLGTVALWTLRFPKEGESPRPWEIVHRTSVMGSSSILDSILSGLGAEGQASRQELEMVFPQTGSWARWLAD